MDNYALRRLAATKVCHCLPYLLSLYAATLRSDLRLNLPERSHVRTKTKGGVLLVFPWWITFSLTRAKRAVDNL